MSHPTTFRKKITTGLVGGLVLLSVILLWNEFDRRIEGTWSAPGEWWGKRATLKNYGDDVSLWAEKFDLPAAYLLALIQLESGGRKPAGKRFESHVYKRLQAVRDGKRTRYENIRTADLEGASDEALHNLATSWGPFQLMGYKCILLDLQIRDIRGKDAVQAGVTWIDQTYGVALREGRFEDAFHMHNTGKAYPKSGPPTTFHPDYVVRGMRYMLNFTDDASE